MIFVTTGLQLEFPRLIKIVTNVVREIGYENELIIQTLNPQKSSCAKFETFLTEDDYLNFIKKADLVIAHAGIGTVLSCLEFKKPIIIIPRQYSLREHRNNHQIETSEYLKNNPNIYIVNNEQELKNLILNPPVHIPPRRDENQQQVQKLHEFVESFIHR